MEKIHKISFAGGFCSYAAIYAAASAPIPLYSGYRQAVGLTNGDLSLSSVLYFLGTVIALLLFARISNYFGRKVVIIAAILLAMLGCFSFYFLNSGALFLFGRMVQGLSCGLSSSCLAAYLVDVAGEKRGAAAAVSAPMLGLAVGSFGAGVLVEYEFSTMNFIYVPVLAALFICLALVICGQETVARKSFSLSALSFKLYFPPATYRLLPEACAVFAATWAIGGFYQAFSASIAYEQLGTPNVLVAAAVFACLQAPNIIGSSIAGKMSVVNAKRIGMTAFLLSILAVVYNMGSGNAALFLLASACTGMSWGLAYTGSLSGILAHTSASDRAAVLSAVYIISYSGAALPNLVVSRIADNFNLFEIGIGYAAVVFAAWLIVAAGAVLRQLKEKMRISAKIF